MLMKFKYKSTCELCDNIQDKDKRGLFMAKKCSVLHEEVIDVFNEKIYIPTIEKLSFHVSYVRIIGSMVLGKTRNDSFHDNASKINIKLKKYYSEKLNETTGIEI